MTVLAPLRYVTCQVIQSKHIGLPLSCGAYGHDVAISFFRRNIGIKRHILQDVRPGVEGIRAILASMGGIFPFGFGRESELLAGEFAESLDEVLALYPTDVTDRQVGLALVLAWIFAHDGIPEFLGDFRLAEVVV